MSSGGTVSGTLGALLAAERRRLLVGRTAEIEVFSQALSGAGPRVLYVHGPGGIGKTSLLDRYAALAGASGVPVVWLDGRDLEPTPRGFGDAIAAPRPTGRWVLLVDTYERLAGLDDWVRDTLLPRLPAGTVVVLAGRTRPAEGWRVDPAWRELLGVLPLRHLDAAESGEYLRRCGLPQSLYSRMFQVTHGHPLALSLLTDVVRRGGGTAYDPLSPDLVGVLLRRFVDSVPDEDQRRALEVCGLARVTTEPLLRAALAISPARARELFDWLAGLSFVESGPDGLFPHDLARDALDAQLRWRDPEAYRRVFRGISDATIERLAATAGTEQQRVILDAKFMHRHQAVSTVWADWNSFGQHYLEPASPADRDEILELVAHWEGADAAGIAELWWHRQPAAFHVVRRHAGGLQGVITSIDLSTADPEALAADPGTRAAADHARRLGAEGLLTQQRFVVDRDAYQQPSPTLNLAPVRSIQHWLATPGLTLDYLTLATPERWEEYFAFFEIHRVAGGDFTVGGTRYGLFVRDFRRIPVGDWLRLMLERDLTGEPARPREAAPLLLSAPEFAEAVRQALRNLRRGDQLARNPLLRSRLVTDPDPAALARVVRDAAARLRDDPRDEKLYRVLDRTYLRPAASQEKAAELLDLPMSTYKRHLRRAVTRVVDLLWDRELHAGQ